MRHAFLAALLAAAVLVGATTVSHAGERTVTLKVDMGGCSSCSWIVSDVLERVPGVAAVEVIWRERTAVVRYDDEKTDVAALVNATTSYGYPTEVLAADQES